jgi:hypothetical protein
MQNHTKGPWEYSKGSPYGKVDRFLIQTVDKDHKNSYIGEIGGGLQSNEEIEANAKLIAEAPAIKELFQDLADRLNNCRSYLMEVDPKKLTVEDCLEAFGFGKNGLEG